jgi:hypothetical protein
MNKVVALSVVVALVFIGLWIVEPTSQEGDKDSATRQESKAGGGETETGTGAPAALDTLDTSVVSSPVPEAKPAIDYERNAQLLAEQEAEISQLMEEYQSFSGDREARAAKKEEIRQKLDAYNEVVLPEALRQMEALQEGEALQQIEK